MIDFNTSTFDGLSININQRKQKFQCEAYIFLYLILKDSRDFETQLTHDS